MRAALIAVRTLQSPQETRVPMSDLKNWHPHFLMMGMAILAIPNPPSLPLLEWLRPRFGGITGRGLSIAWR